MNEDGSPLKFYIIVFIELAVLFFYYLKIYPSIKSFRAKIYWLAAFVGLFGPFTLIGWESVQPSPGLGPLGLIIFFSPIMGISVFSLLGGAIFLLLRFCRKILLHHGVRIHSLPGSDWMWIVFIGVALFMIVEGLPLIYSILARGRQ